MNKLNVHTPSFTNLPAVESDSSVHRVISPELPRRLIVLVPPDSDSTGVTRRICRLANETNSDVQLLGLCSDMSEEMTLRRELVTVSALIRAAKISAEIRVEVGNNWLNAVKHNYREGDAIVCIAEQSIGIRRRPLSQILQSTLQAPVHILTASPSPKPQAIGLARVIAAWSGFLGIMIAFFIVQVKIIQVSTDGFQTVMLLVVLIPEFWLIKMWNSLFS